MKWIRSKIADTAFIKRQPVNLENVVTFYNSTWAQRPAIYFSCGNEYGVYWMYDSEIDRSIDFDALNRIINKHSINL